MKETVEKQVIQYATKTLPELLSLAIAGDKQAAGEIVRRQEAATAEIESLKVKAYKARAPKAEKTPLDLAKDNAYFRTALLVKQFGQDQVTMQTLTAASAYLEQGFAQGNLRQALNRVQQVLKAQKVEEQVFPEWIVQAGEDIPVLDENKKLEEEAAKVEEIKAVIQKYVAQETQADPETQAAPETQADPETQAKKTTSKKAGGK